MASKINLPIPQGYARKFETEDFLVRRLVARGLVVPDEIELRNILRVVGYYRLTGYLYPFRKLNSDDYEPGTTLDKVWRLYNFDRRLRLVVSDALARIEVAVRTRIMERHSLAFGGDPFVYCKSAALADLYACVSIQAGLRHTTLFTAMSLCAWLLHQVRPESHWKERVKALLDDYPDVSLSAMGFPDNWRNYALWK